MFHHVHIIQDLQSVSGWLVQRTSMTCGTVVDFGALVVEGLRAQDQLASQPLETLSDTGRLEDLSM